MDYFYEAAANRYQVFCSRLIAQRWSLCSYSRCCSSALHSIVIFILCLILLMFRCLALLKILLITMIQYFDGLSFTYEILDRYAQFLDGRCLIISNDKPNLTFNYTFKKWTYEDFVDSLLLCDVGFLPRTLESSYTINNSSFKALVFAVLGLPIIANQLPSYQELSNSYHSISFLENHNYCPVSALSSLKSMSNSVSVVRQSY